MAFVRSDQPLTDGNSFAAFCPGVDVSCCRDPQFLAGWDEARAEMSLELSRERGCPALKVSYYSDQGKLQQYSHWVQLSDGTWERCSV